MWWSWLLFENIYSSSSSSHSGEWTAFPAPDSGSGHVTYFGQWDVSRYPASRSLKAGVWLGLLSSAYAIWTAELTGGQPPCSGQGWIARGSKSVSPSQAQPESGELPSCTQLKAANKTLSWFTDQWDHIPVILSHWIFHVCHVEILWQLFGIRHGYLFGMRNWCQSWDIDTTKAKK
jgi:hypothetical protein